MSIFDKGQRGRRRLAGREHLTPTGPRPILQVTSRYPPELGGMERVVQELSEALAEELDVAVEVVAGTRGTKPGTSREGPLTVRRLRSFNVLVTPVIPGLFPALIRRARPALIHVHVGHAGTPEIAALVSWLQRVPLIAHVHIDAGPTTWLGFLLASYQRYLLKAVYMRASLIVVPTDSYRTLLIEKYALDPDRVRVLSNGTNMARRERDELPAGPPPATIRLVSVGRIAQEKNLPLLIDAVDVLVNKEGLDVTLEIVGDGPARERVQQHVVALGLEGRIRLIGRLAGAELAGSYDRADIFVMTSLSESFGTVLVEAMARRVPVIAPDMPGVRDVVVDGKTGLLVEHTVESVCNAVLRIRREPGLREHLLAGVDAAFHRYEWPEIARQCAKLYEEVLETPLGARPVEAGSSSGARSPMTGTPHD